MLPKKTKNFEKNKEFESNIFSLQKFKLRESKNDLRRYCTTLKGENEKNIESCVRHTVSKEMLQTQWEEKR